MDIESASRQELVQELLAARRRLADLESRPAGQEEAPREGRGPAPPAADWAPIVLFTTDDEGVVTSATGRLIHDVDFRQVLGPDAPSLVGKPFFEFAPDADQMAQRFAQALAGETTVAIDVRAGRTIESRLAPLRAADGEIAGAIGVVCDLTGYAHAETAQRESDQRYRDLFNGVPVGLYQTTPDGLIVDANRALAEMLGVPDPAGLVHRQATDFYVNPADRESWCREIESEGTVRDFEFRLRRTDGRAIWVRDSARVVRDREGRVRHYEGMMQDVTDRRWAEEMFAHLAFLVRSTDDAIIAADLDGTIRTWNPAAERIYGYPAEEACAESIVMLALPEQRRELLAILERIEQGERMSHLKTVQVRRDGSRLDVSLTMSPIIEGDGTITGASIIARDMTEQAQMEQRVIRAERLVAMSHVAATLAHEIKNPLQALQSNLELALDFPLEPDEHRRALRLCLEETEHMIEITERVLSLARTDREGREPVSVQSLVERMHELLAQSLQEAEIEMRVELADDLPPVVAYPAQIVQVLVNIVMNAIEVLHRGGTIAISAAVDGPMLALTVANNGPSIAPEALTQIFEPFFTTHPKGTGLGLFVSHNIVEQHGGRLEVDNLADGGVAFTLTLPVLAGGEEGG